MDKICPVCGTIFHTTPSNIKRGRGKVCSIKCRGMLHRGENNPSFGRENTPEERYKKGSAFRDKPLSEQHKQNISNGRKGKPHPHKGYERPDLKGEKNPNWNNGSSFIPYCKKFNIPLRRRVRGFFGDCVLCGKTSEENGKMLEVHHVYNEKSTCCDGKRPLFVALCRSCHSKVTVHKKEDDGKRIYWEKYFTKMIDEQYDGKCYLPKVMK